MCVCLCLKITRTNWRKCSGDNNSHLAFGGAGGWRGVCTPAAYNTCLMYERTGCCRRTRLDCYICWEKWGIKCIVFITCIFSRIQNCVIIKLFFYKHNFFVETVIWMKFVLNTLKGLTNKINLLNVINSDSHIFFINNNPMCWAVGCKWIL